MSDMAQSIKLINVRKFINKNFFCIITLVQK